MPNSTNLKAQHVWEKARRVKGKNPSLYRRDAQGNLIYKPAYNRDSPMGWQVDHIWPRSKGGSDERRNLQACRGRPEGAALSQVASGASYAHLVVRCTPGFRTLFRSSFFFFCSAAHAG